MAKKKKNNEGAGWLFDHLDSPTIADNPFRPGIAERNTVDHKMLALDLATKTGWCTRKSSGVWNFTPKKKDHVGMRVFQLLIKLREICEAEGIKLIVYELPIIFSSKKRRPNFNGFEMIGVMKLHAIESGIRVQGFQLSKIKKFATGNGIAKKEMMVSACISMYGITPDDNNEADALHLYHLAIAHNE